MICVIDKNFLIFNPHKTATRTRMNMFKHLHDNEINLFKKFNIKPKDINNHPITQICGPHTTIKSYVRFLEYVNKSNSQFTKYCFVRNPWDRAISMFHMQNKYRGIEYSRPYFKKYILNCSMNPMHDFYLFNDQIYVDHILQFEKLKEGVSLIKSKHDLDLKKFRTQESKWSKIPYKEWFDQEMIDHVAKKEFKTIEIFDYKFE